MARGHHFHPPAAHTGHEAWRKRGGGIGNPETKRRIPEEREGPMESYTAGPNREEEEAEGEERMRGGKARRARGGSVSHHDGKHHVAHHHAEPATVVHHHYKRGGSAPKKHVGMEGEKTKHRRLDRPGRKRGGGIGADMTPLTTAARAHPASAHHADADELAE